MLQLKINDIDIPTVSIILSSKIILREEYGERFDIDIETGIIKIKLTTLCLKGEFQLSEQDYFTSWLNQTSNHGLRKFELISEGQIIKASNCFITQIAFPKYSTDNLKSNVEFEAEFSFDLAEWTITDPKLIPEIQIKRKSYVNCF